MYTAARTTQRRSIRGAPSAALLAVAILAGGAPALRAAPAVAAPARAPTNVSAQPASATPASAPTAIVPTAPVIGTVRAPVPLIVPALQPAVVQAGSASFAPVARTLLRDAVLLTGRPYMRNLLIPSSGTIQVIAVLRGSCDATLRFEPASRTGGEGLAAALWAPAANPRHGPTLIGQRMLREYQVTTQQVANGGNFLVAIEPVAATPCSVPSELSVEISLK